ncbi:MAG: 1-acyl-sn-glycerol-3-phosphate acyltransferase [Ferruginibacter sp.]
MNILARIAFPFYCRTFKVNHPDLFQSKGPILLASNHPNSFLDAIILCTHFKQPIYSLARGDAFKNPFTARLLKALNILPIYRESEGVENMDINYKTFEQCRQIFRNNGIVLIFSEGRCINEWHFRALKKGTARIAFSCWEEGIPLKVLPVAINYNSFRNFGKVIHLYFGKIITHSAIEPNESFGKKIQSFNQILKGELSPFVYEIAATDKQHLKDKFAIQQPQWINLLLAPFAFIGWLLYTPFIRVLQWLVDKMNNDNDHYDSILVSLFFFIFPFLLALFTAIVAYYFGVLIAIIAFAIALLCFKANISYSKK